MDYSDVERPPKEELEDASARWGWDGAAEEYEVDEATIIRWLREGEMAVRPGRVAKAKPTPAAKSPGRPRKHDHELIKALYEIHQSIRIVADCIGCSESVVSHATRPQSTEWLPMSLLAEVIGSDPKAARSGHRKGDLVKGYRLEKRSAQNGHKCRYEYRATRVGHAKSVGQHHGALSAEESVGWHSSWALAKRLGCSRSTIENGWKFGRKLRGMAIMRRAAHEPCPSSRKWEYALGWPS